MAKYTLEFIDIVREYAVQRNIKNGKVRIFNIGKENGFSQYYPISKEFAKVSHIAPAQNNNYVVFVASNKSDKVLFLNDGRKYKIRNFEKHIIDYTQKHTPTSLARFWNKNTPKIYKHKDGLFVISHKDFGEILYDPIHDALSHTFNTISAPNSNGDRIVYLNTLSNQRMSYYSSSFNLIGEPFYKIIKDFKLPNKAPSLTLVADKNKYNQLSYYFLNENHIPCSKKYANITTLDNLIIAATSKNNLVILNEQGKESSPEFVDIKPIGENYVLQLNNDNSNYVLYSPCINNEQQNNAKSSEMLSYLNASSEQLTFLMPLQTSISQTTTENDHSMPENYIDADQLSISDMFNTTLPDTQQTKDYNVTEELSLE